MFDGTYITTSDSKVVAMWVQEAVLLLFTLVSQGVHCADLGLALAKRFPEYTRRKLPLKAGFSAIRPSDDLPVLNLFETKDSRLDPSRSDLDQTKLMNILGDKYDHEFMAIVRPIESIRKPNGTLKYRFRKGMHPKGEMPKDIKRLQLKNVDLPGGPSLKIKFGRRTRQKIQRFLWVYSYCPVRYQWKDLGSRFWPRWIKEGRCDNSKPCSIPAGMKCSQKSSTTKTILRWYCRRSVGKDIKYCKWIPIQYPIISECSCGC